jgi:hypothetical protein
MKRLHRTRERERERQRERERERERERSKREKDGKYRVRRWNVARVQGNVAEHDCTGKRRTYGSSDGRSTPGIGAGERASEREAAET